jgi:hypothetical protein
MDKEYQKQWLKTEAGQKYIEQHREYQKKWRERNREQFNQGRKKSQCKVRKEALEHYGGIPPKCALCRSNRKLRISPLSSKESPYILRAAGWPEGQRILCWSCVKKERSKRIIQQKIWKDPETGLHRNWHQQEVSCSWCEKPTLKKRCHLKSKEHFCGHECHGKWKSEHLKGQNNPGFKSVKISCKQCAFEILAKPSRIKRSKRGVFCSVECHNDWRRENVRGAMLYNWNGGYEPYYGESWVSAKRRTRDRDGHVCQCCGKTREQLGKNLDVHHKTPFREFGMERHIEANALSNLISYCNSCHKIIEANAVSSIP